MQSKEIREHTLPITSFFRWIPSLLFIQRVQEVFHGWRQLIDKSNRDNVKINDVVDEVEIAVVVVDDVDDDDDDDDDAVVVAADGDDAVVVVVSDMIRYQHKLKGLIQNFF